MKLKKMKNIYFISALSLFACIQALAQETYPIDRPLDGPLSQYTPKVVDMIKNWKEKDMSGLPEDNSQVGLECFKTGDVKYYIGVRQKMLVNSKFQELEKVLDDIDGYKEIMPDLKVTKILHKDKNLLTTQWEQIVPVFFISNVRYEVFYLLHSPKPGLKFYRYKLKESKDLIVSDGMIAIEDLGNGKTLFTEYDFWDAHWGALTTFAPGSIWKDSVKGIYLSDLGLKFKAEHPDWDGDKVLEEAEDQFDKNGESIRDHCIENKKEFSRR